MSVAYQDQNGQIVQYDDGSIAEVVPGEGCSPCCTPPCSDAACPNGSSVVRVACDSQFQYASQVTVSGGGSVTREPSQSRPSSGTYAPRYNLDLGLPTRSTFTLDVTFDAPTPLPGPANGTFGRADSGGTPWGWGGYYHKITVGSSTFEFDGRGGLGFAVEISTGETHPPGYPSVDSGGPYGPYVYTGGEPIVHEIQELNYRVVAQPSVRDGDGGFAVAGGMFGVFERERTYNMSSHPDSPAAGYYSEGRGSYGLGLLATSAYTASVSPASPVPDVCGGATQTGTLVLDGDEDGASGDVGPPQSFGSWTMGLVNPDDAGIPEGEYGGRQCPCAIRVTGTIYYYDTVAQQDDGGYYTNFVGCPIDVRMTRIDTRGCHGGSGARWSGVGTVTQDGQGKPLEADLYRVGPKLWSIDVAHPLGRIRFNAGDDGCPTGVTAVDQFEQPHRWVSHNPNRPTYERRGGGAMVTANALTIVGVARDPDNDPPCGLCDAGCEDCSTANATLTVAAPCPNLPDVPVMRVTANPCLYSGGVPDPTSGDSMDARIEYDAGTQEYVLSYRDRVRGLVSYEARRACAGGVAGSYTLTEMGSDTDLYCTPTTITVG